MRMRSPMVLGGVLAVGVGAGLLGLAYSQRSFAALVLALACGLVALALWIRPLRSAVTLLVSLLLALALAEFALGWLQGRNAEAVAVEFNQGTERAGQYWNTSALGVSPKPGVHHVRKATAGGELIYDVRYTIGDDGFRITPGADAQRAGGRVNFLGCSGTFGDGLNDDETLGAQIQSRLLQADVHNLAMSGYGMHQALALLEQNGRVPGKVNVVLTAPWHSERAACVPSFATGSPRYVLQVDGTVARDGVCGGPIQPLARVLSWSRIYGLLKVIAARKNQDAQIDLYLALIKRMVALSHDRGQVMLVGFWPARDEWFAGSYNNAKVLAALRAMNVPVFDLNRGQKVEQIDPALLLHRLDDHPNARGVKIWADMLAPVIAQALAQPGAARTGAVGSSGGATAVTPSQPK